MKSLEIQIFNHLAHLNCRLPIYWMKSIFGGLLAPWILVSGLGIFSTPYHLLAEDSSSPRIQEMSHIPYLALMQSRFYDRDVSFILPSIHYWADKKAHDLKISVDIKKASFSQVFALYLLQVQDQLRLMDLESRIGILTLPKNSSLLALARGEGTLDEASLSTISTYLMRGQNELVKQLQLKETKAMDSLPQWKKWVLNIRSHSLWPMAQTLAWLSLLWVSLPQFSQETALLVSAISLPIILIDFMRSPRNRLRTEYDDPFAKLQISRYTTDAILCALALESQ